MTAYYSASIYGMTPAQIIDHYGLNFDSVCKDLGIGPPGKNAKKQLQAAKQISKLAHGKLSPTAAQKKMMKYQPFVVKLRL